MRITLSTIINGLTTLGMRIRMAKLINPGTYGASHRPFPPCRLAASSLLPHEHDSQQGQHAADGLDDGQALAQHQGGQHQGENGLQIEIDERSGRSDLLHRSLPEGVAYQQGQRGIDQRCPRPERAEDAERSPRSPARQPERLVPMPPPSARLWPAVLARDQGLREHVAPTQVAAAPSAIRSPSTDVPSLLPASPTTTMPHESDQHTQSADAVGPLPTERPPEHGGHQRAHRGQDNQVRDTGSRQPADEQQLRHANAERPGEGEALPVRSPDHRRCPRSDTTAKMAAAAIIGRSAT